MILEILPYKSAGNILLGAFKEEINLLLGNEFKYTTYEYSVDSSDYYKDLGLRIEYDKNLNCISLHISSPSQPEYNDENLLNLKFRGLQTAFPNERDAFIQENNVLFIDTGIGFTFGDDIENSSVRTITIFTEKLFEPFIQNYDRLW